MQVTCSVPPGNRLYLAAEITNADGHGHTEYYFPRVDWEPRTDTSATQSHQATITSGVTRTWYLVSASQAGFQSLKDQPDNVASDGGLFRITGLPVVSNRQTTRQTP